MGTRRLVLSAVIGAVYAATTILLAPISYGAVQFRISEALTVLPFFYPTSIWGLFIGCLIANFFSPSVTILDIIFGSLATLLAGYLTSKMKSKWLAPLPPVVVNAVIIGFVIAYTAAPGAMLEAFPPIAMSVGLGELGACYLIGLPLLYALSRVKLFGLDELKKQK
jgi:uncharacterized membrane protein